MNQNIPNENQKSWSANTAQKIQALNQQLVQTQNRKKRQELETALQNQTEDEQEQVGYDLFALLDRLPIQNQVVANLGKFGTILNPEALSNLKSFSEGGWYDTVEISRINQILANLQEFSQCKQIAVGGRVIAARESKKILFAEVNDGSILCPLQLIFSRELLPHLPLGSVVKVQGQLVLVPQLSHQLELRVQVCELKYKIMPTRPISCHKRDLVVRTYRRLDQPNQKKAITQLEITKIIEAFLTELQASLLAGEPDGSPAGVTQSQITAFQALKKKLESFLAVPPRVNPGS
ncbi:34684_t:CDS:2, partial [Racocetra persica]